MAARASSPSGPSPPSVPFDESVETISPVGARVIYWHRELPPRGAEPMGEHIVEALSARTPSSLAHGDELWVRCYEDLMARVRARIEQEVLRLGGSCAHVLSESVDSRHDNVTGESYLHGRFTYMLYRQPGGPPLARR